MFFKRGKSGFEINELGKVLIAVVILVILVGGAILFKDKIATALASLNHVFRTGTAGIA
jgi:hypothetical protein